MSLWMSSLLIRDTWMEWQNNPTAFITKDVSISEIPFPTVTICPGIKSVKEKFDLAAKFTDANELTTNLSDAELVL